MKIRISLGVVVFTVLSAFATAEPILKEEQLHLSAEVTITDGEAADETKILSVQPFIENKGPLDICVLLFGEKRVTKYGSKIMFLFDLGRSSDNRLLKTSHYLWEPVILRAGEIAKLPEILFRIKRGEQQVLPAKLIYCIKEEAAKTYGLWAGTLEISLGYDPASLRISEPHKSTKAR